MKVYFAHSFEHMGQGARLSTSDNPKLLAFLSVLNTSQIAVIDPAENNIPATDPEARFKFCLREIEGSDVLVVDASNRLGIGVGAEMMFAKIRKMQIFVICPDQSYYRKHISMIEDSWIHPFIHGLSSKVFLSFDECARELVLLSNRNPVYG